MKNSIIDIPTVVAVGLLPTGSYEPVYNPSYWNAAEKLVIAPNLDYHWYIQNSDGYWSHKRGYGEATNLDASGYRIIDPQTCDRDYGGGLNYSTFCGYYIVTR